MRVNNEIKQLCLNLMEANSEEGVINLLRDTGYWDDPTVWRHYGDYENNYNTIGNQQSSPDAALVEKIVNAVDARLMNECLERGIDPAGPVAPQSIQEAVARFFEEGVNPTRATAGLIREWSDSKRTEVARGITLAATGAKSNPCFTIADTGEGQAPEDMPNTFLSLTKNNKLRIPFVQGKFNMGGTGVLKFCGEHGLQLIISRRNPAILAHTGSSRESDGQWGFTVVRREYPTGNRRSSVYTYLAPVDASKHPGHGGVLRFDSEEMPIFPDGQEPCGRMASYGSLVKLYEYGTRSRTHMFMKGGMKRPLDLLLPDLALPVRLHECRAYSGHAGSFETTLTGVKVRLEDDKAANLEPAFPTSAPIRVAGEEMSVTIYALKKGKDETYRSNEGIIFTVNGQTHGYFTQDFFRRKKVGLSYLRDSILVIVDCTKLSGKARENLFMNSRDRLSEGELRSAIDSELEELLKRHPGLRELSERRRREELEAKLDDSKPLANILQDLLRDSPTLSDLFLFGKRVSTPFKTQEAQEEEEEFKGKPYPTFFKFKNLDYGRELERNCPINRRCRLTFETDVVNDYFDRNVNSGEFALNRTANGQTALVEDYSLNLHNGIATLSLPVPPNAQVGDTLGFRAIVQDRTQVQPFENCFKITVLEAQKASTGGSGTRRKPPGSSKGKGRELPSGITLPNIILVEESEWETRNPPFDEYTALRIKHAGMSSDADQNDGEVPVYDFYINIDNTYLRNELKYKKKEPKLAKAQFKYGLVLLGLGLIHQATLGENGSDGTELDGEENIEDQVALVTRATAPILLPMIESLAALSLED